MDDWYELGAILFGSLAFIAIWIYAFASWGFLFGLAIGWLPALIGGFVIGLLWPIIGLLLVGMVALLIKYHSG